MSSTRPEHQAPPELFYNESEAQKYETSSRMKKIQRELTERAIEVKKRMINGLLLMLVFLKEFLFIYFLLLLFVFLFKIFNFTYNLVYVIVVIVIG